MNGTCFLSVDGWEVPTQRQPTKARKHCSHASLCVSSVFQIKSISIWRSQGCVNHGWDSTCSAVHLLFGSGCIITSSSL